MSKCNAVVAPLEIGENLRKDINYEFISVTLYKQIIGSLRYLCDTRTYICQSVGLLNKFMVKLRECNFIAVNRVFRFIKGTTDHGVFIPRRRNTNIYAEVHGHAD